MNPAKIFYLCRINTSSDQRRFGDSLHIGPAYQKLMHVAQALVSVEADISLVTVPVFNEIGLKKSKLGIARYVELGVNVISLGSVCNKFFSRFYAAFAFLIFVISNVKRSDKVIIYNYFPEYFISAIYLWFLGNRAILDIEDAPRADEAGVVGCFTRFSFRVLRIFCQKRYITVSSMVATKLNLNSYLLVYGASPQIVGATCNLRNLNFGNSKGEWIKVLYGGALLQETGIALFCSAIEKLSQISIDPNHGLEIVVTGFGGESDLENSMKLNFPKWLRLKVKTNISYLEYKEILQDSHVGLCLKIPGTTMADTTFPSKVVEIVRAKLLLISTPTSDVPVLFDHREALLLQTPYVDSLVKMLVDLVISPDDFIDIAEAGIRRSNEVFSYQSVGNKLSTWLLFDKSC